jgi:hypothetical protein
MHAEGKDVFVDFENLDGARAKMKTRFRVLKDKQMKEKELKSPFVLDELSFPETPYVVSLEDIPQAMIFQTHIAYLKKSRKNTGKEVYLGIDGKFEEADKKNFIRYIKTIEGLAENDPLQITENTPDFYNPLEKEVTDETQKNNDQIIEPKPSDEEIERTIFRKHLQAVKERNAGKKRYL